MTKYLTVGIDGSAPARRAMDWAANEAERLGATVKAVACVQPPTFFNPWYVGVPYDMDEIRAESSISVRVAIERACLQHPDLAYEEVVVTDNPRTALVAEAADSELLVVGTTGAGAVESWLLGSVAHAVARTSPCPVVLVPNTDLAPPSGRIVAAVDGSPASYAALAWAGDEADARDGELVVVHAWTYYFGTELASQSAADLVRVDAQTVLDAAVERARERVRVRVRGELLEATAGEAIVECAADADLVVVGSRGRGGLRSAVFGSVAHGVASHSSTPTVIVRAPAR
jgi:nucleotide-binding universal stress UspA family protein